jgi:hypothetical protein
MMRIKIESTRFRESYAKEMGQIIKDLENCMKENNETIDACLMTFQEFNK